MHILVTGGAGFIGSALAKKLVDEGHQVTVLDNFNEYYDVSLKHSRVRELLTGVEIVHIDITDKNALSHLFQTHTFDAVAHLAAQAGVRYSVEAPEVYVATNVLGTQTLLETMKNAGVTTMVFASTSSVYGTDTKAPFAEDAPADKPVSVYAATKRAGELLAYTYHQQYGMNITCLRFFTVYGPWSRPDMAMLKFAQKIMKGESIDVYNNGDLRRDFTHVDDIVTGFVRAIEKPLGYEIINLGNGKPVELLSFIQLLEQSLGAEAKKNMLPMQPGDVYETYANTDKASKILGCKARVDFKEGIGSFVDWYRTYYGM